MYCGKDLAQTFHYCLGMNLLRHNDPWQVAQSSVWIWWFYILEPQFMLNVQISRGMIHKDASSNLLFRVWQYKRGNSRSLQIRFEMVNKYTIPRMSVWCFESTISLRFTNRILLLCYMYVILHIFTCLTFIYFTFLAAVNSGEVKGWTWQNICWMVCIFLWSYFWCHGIRISDEWVKFVFSLERTYILTSVAEYVLFSLRERATGTYDMESYGIWRDEVHYYAQFSMALDEWSSQWQHHSKILGVILHKR